VTKHRVASHSDLAEGELRAVEAGGVRICLAKSNGCFFALDDTCTHEGALLSDGEIYKGSVQCPMHSSLFDLASGEVTGLPAMIAARTYSVTVENGEVFIEV
jgi:3-phenylpropionate/trans-cinnamate dioxygenase ferredoxin subunit/ethylbenzene dioxygenase ferredoxin subunit